MLAWLSSCFFWLFRLFLEAFFSVDRKLRPQTGEVQGTVVTFVPPRVRRLPQVLMATHDAQPALRQLSCHPAVSSRHACPGTAQSTVKRELRAEHARVAGVTNLRRRYEPMRDSKLSLTDIITKFCGALCIVGYVQCVHRSPARWTPHCRAGAVGQPVARSKTCLCNSWQPQELPHLCLCRRISCCVINTPIISVHASER